MTEGTADYATPASQRLSERLLSPVRDDAAALVQDDKLTLLGAEERCEGALTVTLGPCPAAVEVEASFPYFVLRQLECNELAEKASHQPDCLEGAAETMMAHQQWARRPAAAISSSHATTLCGKIVLTTLALIGCMCLASGADAVFTESASATKMVESMVPPFSHVNSLIFHGTRLTDIHPSLLETPDNSSENTGGKEPGAIAGKEKKSKRRGRERKAPSSSESSPEEGRFLEALEDSDEGKASKKAKSSAWRPKFGLRASVSNKRQKSRKTPETAEGERGKWLMATAFGKMIEADLQSSVSPIVREVTASFATSISDRKEVLEAIEAVTADGTSCLEALANKLNETWVGLFPHEMQHVREGLLIFLASQKLMEELQRSNGVPRCLSGTYTVKSGSSVKMLDQNRYTGERVFFVQSVEGTMVTLNGVGQAVDRHHLITAADPVETRFVDMALQGSWSDLEKEETELFAQLLEFAEKSGFKDSLNVAKTTGNPSGLLEALLSSSAVARLVAGVREILEAPSPSVPKGEKRSKGWKDISRTHTIFTAHASTKMAETLQILTSHHAFPGCLSLTASNLMVQGSPLLVRLLGKFLTGSHLESPSDQAMDDTPVARMQVVSKLRVIHKLPRTKLLETQCQAGMFSELGINGPAVGKFGCFEQWKRTVGSPHGPGYSKAAHLYALTMRSVCAIERTKKPQNQLIPPGLLEGCGPDCLVKASMRKLWLDTEMQNRRKRYALKPKDLVVGDALRMSAHFSLKELTDLDDKLASAWLVAKLLLDAARGPAGKLLTRSESEVTAQLSASERSSEAERSEEQLAASGTASTSEPASDDAQTSSLFENTSQEEPKKATSRNSVSTPQATFVIGGNVNVNAVNMIATFQVCKGLAQQGLPNLGLLAQSAFTNIRGYVSAAGAGLQDTKRQRKMAKGSAVYSAIYQFFMCGFSGDMLPPVFLPYASLAMQVASFLRIELEESASLSWDNVVQAAGEGVFSLKRYDAAMRHLRNKSMKFLDAFTPCVAQVNQPTDLLQLPQGSRKGGGLLRKLKSLVNRSQGRRNQANAAMCEISGEQQQLVRMLVAWWTLGPMSSNRKSRAPTTVAETFRSARLLFADYVFFNGQDPVQIGMELIKAGCKSNKFSVPLGWAMGAKKDKPSSKPLSFKEISPRLLASLKFLQSSLGSADLSDLTMPLKASQKLVDSCGQSETVSFAELLSTEEGGTILMAYQCMTLQEQAVKVIATVFGKRSKAENRGLAYVLLRFLNGLHVVKSLKSTKDILTAFGKFVNTSEEEGQQALLKEWNGDFPNVACAWKQNDRVKEAMLKKGAGYTPPPPPAGSFAAAVTDLHCPAATPLHVGDLAKASQPDARDFCTSSSAQCAAADFEGEYDLSVL
ncbi:hypothetical protein Esti_005658 [Eimeria stiedai]